MSGVLVTGGAGFIGRRVVARLRAAGRAVTVLDDLSAGSVLLSESGGLAVLRGDIRDPAAVRAALALQPVAALIHLAALHHIPTCAADPARTISINIDGTQTVLDVAAAAGIRRVVLASSAAVYAPATTPHDEGAATGPIEGYGLSKLTNEDQLARWCVRHGGAGRIARIFNAIGPGDPNGHLIPDLLARLRGDEAELRLGNAETVRDYVDVGDIAAGLCALLDDPDPDPMVTYNLCRGVGVRTEELATALMVQLGRMRPLRSDPALRREQDRPHLVGDPELAARGLGWRATRPLAATLADIAAVT